MSGKKRRRRRTFGARPACASAAPRNQSRCWRGGDDRLSSSSCGGRRCHRQDRWRWADGTRIVAALCAPDRRRRCGLHERQSLLRCRVGAADACNSADRQRRSLIHVQAVDGLLGHLRSHQRLYGRASLAACSWRCPFEKISTRYFFESDMLFRLGTLRARVLDIPMRAVYADEKSGLSVRHVAGEFGLKHLRNFGKRIFYNYFLRNFSFASIELIFGSALLMFGAVFGAVKWAESAATGSPHRPVPS